MTAPPSRRSPYLWLCLAATAVVAFGFSVTYFGPMMAGEYPPVSPTVHLHGWTFFLWYLLLPLQAGLIAARRVALHRRLGLASIALAVAMVATGMVVIGTQMELARQPDGNPFWQFLGPGVWTTLVLFVVYYVLALRHRKQREQHKRYMLLASTAALGAAGFRAIGRVIGFGPAAGIAGILAPNLIIVAAMLIEWRRGEGVHRIYRWGLPLSFGFELGVILLTPTPAGQLLANGLAWMGRLLAPLY
jgi:hypothetical protein